jgi:hypothetical protein
MKTGVILLILVLALGGCIARNLSLSRDEAALARFQDVLVVAMEPPPLMVPPRFESAILGTLPKYPIQAARVGGVLTSVAILAEMPVVARRSTEASRRLEELLSQEGPWEPTKILAQEAASRLSAAGQRRVSLRPKMQPIPGLGDRHFNPLTRNWLGPTRNWYNQAEAPGRFQGEATAKMGAVVEIAIMNYEINPDNQLSLQVLVKVVDPATGQVIGRARVAERFAVGPYDQAFTRNLRQFKEVFALRGKELIAKCLTEAGLI